MRGAAAELGVTDAAVSSHMAALRRELGDRLFSPSGGGLVFTPGGLRLASRAVQLLGLQELTRREVIEAAAGQRVLRLAATSLFVEHAATGLIELFSGRADDLGVELSVERSDRMRDLLERRAVDVAIGPGLSGPPAAVETRPFLRYEVMVVAGRSSPLAGRDASHRELASVDWSLGPSAAEPAGVTHQLLDTFAVPEDRQRIHQSHAAALEEVRRGGSVGTALSMAIDDELASGGLVRVTGPATVLRATWTAMTLSTTRRSRLASELLSFVARPRALRAMVAGSGIDVRRFRPSVHVTLWS